MNYIPEMDGISVLQILTLEDTGFDVVIDMGGKKLKIQALMHGGHEKLWSRKDGKVL